MRKSLLTLAAALMLSVAPARAQEAEWSALDKSLLVSAAAALVVDWGQTRYIAKNPDRYYERNPILGKHPSVGKVDAYFATALIGGAVAAYYIPAEYRTLFLGGVLLMETVVVARNRKIGIKVSF